MRALGVAAAIALGLSLGSASASTARTVSCSTHGLQRAHALAIVRIRAEGVACGVARGAASRVAAQLARGSSISVPGTNGLTLSSMSCTGCPNRTSVSLAYPSGSVTVTLKGTAGRAHVPAFPSLRTIPFPAPVAPSPPGPVV